MSECCDNNHPDHKAMVPNLNRASGQIDGIKKMIEERRYCPDILTQLRATRSALKTIEANILEVHLGSCVTDAFQKGSKTEQAEKLAEIKEIFKRYED